MGRIIETGETSAKRRHAHMRSCAEVLRLLAESGRFGNEEKDMAAFLVFNLRGIYQSIEESAQAWDEKNYWKKAENLRQTWRWSRLAADELAGLIHAGRWEDAPALLIGLIPYFNDVTITTITRDADWWCGALRALRREKQSAA